MAKKTLYNQDGLIYVIADTVGHCKVGFSTVKGFEGRLSQIQNGNVFRLKVLHTRSFPRENCRLIEETAHDLLSPYHVRGEWFRTAPDRIISAVNRAVDCIMAMPKGDIDEALNQLYVAARLKMHHESGRFKLPKSEIEEVRSEEEHAISRMNGRSRRVMPGLFNN